MKRSVKSTHFLSLVQCLSLDMSFFSFQNSVSVFLFLFLCLLWLDESLWMHMYINSLGIVFRDRLKWDQVFRLELNLGDGTRVVCFFLETWVLFVLSLFYIGTTYQTHDLQVVSHVLFTIFLICECLAFPFESCSIGWKPIGVPCFPVSLTWRETHFCFCPPNVKETLMLRSLRPMLISRNLITSVFGLTCFTDIQVVWDKNQ